MPGRFRRALITGATSGIGAAFSDVLPADTDLLLTGRNAERLAAEAAKHARAGRQVETVAADLATEDGRAAVIGAARTFSVDLLVNNAGFGIYGPALENDRRAELDMIAVNVTAVVELIHVLLPGMIERARADGTRAGLIVVSSTVAFVPMLNFATYAGTKAFELSYTESLAQELEAAPIDILLLCPGATRTDFFRRAGLGDSFPPHVEAPAAVARKGLAALGHRRVLVSRGSMRLALSTVTLPRRIASEGARRLFGQFASQSR